MNEQNQEHFQAQRHWDMEKTLLRELGNIMDNIIRARYHTIQRIGGVDASQKIMDLVLRAQQGVKHGRDALLLLINEGRLAFLAELASGSTWSPKGRIQSP